MVNIGMAEKTPVSVYMQHNVS